MTAAVIDETTTPDTEPEDDALFDRKPFTLDKPELDNQEADTIRVAFGGTVDLPLNENTAKLLERLRLGHDTSLAVTGHVSSKTFQHKVDGEGDETVVHQIKVTITDADRLTLA